LSLKLPSQALTRIRPNYWVFQEIDAILESNQVAPVWAIPDFLIHLLDFEDGSESHPYLDVVVHREFVRMGSQAQGVVFFLFHVDPVGDEVFVEDVAAQQEGMISLERFDRAPE